MMAVLYNLNFYIMDRISFRNLTGVEIELDGEKVSIPVTEKNLAMCDSDYEDTREFWTGFKKYDAQVIISTENKDEDSEMLQVKGSYVNIYETGGNEVVGEANIISFS